MGRVERLNALDRILDKILHAQSTMNNNDSELDPGFVSSLLSSC